MKANSKAWTEDELILVLNLYTKLTFAQQNNKNTPEVKRLAEYLGRTTSSITMKFGNFSAIDPDLKNTGLKSVSKLDKEMWGRFFSDEKLILKSEETIKKVFGIKEDISVDEQEDYSGSESERITKQRNRQDFFRTAVLSNFNNKCCITGIDEEKLLIASHIIPWSKDVKNRLNPRNGLCLNALHDKAFDSGLIALDSSLKVVISNKLKRTKEISLLLDFEGQQIIMPEKYMPDVQFLEYHRNNIFLS